MNTFSERLTPSPAQGLHASMALPALALTFFLALAPLLLARGQMHHGSAPPRLYKEAGKCPAPSNWDTKLQFEPKKNYYALNEVVQLSCAEEFVPSVPQIQCISRGSQILWNETATCKKTCQRSAWWDPRLQLAPARDNYTENEEVTLSCNHGFQPSFTHVKCANRVQPLNYSVSLKGDVWLGRKSSGVWIQVQENIVCIETCQKPHWDFRLQLAPDQKSYKKNEEVILSCPKGFLTPFTHVKCTGKVLSIIDGKPVNREAWNGRDSRGSWTSIQPKLRVACLEKCQKPQWDPRFTFYPNQATFNPNEVVKMSCPEGYLPPPMVIKCVTLKPREGSLHSGWMVRSGTDTWHPMKENLTCVEVLQVDPEALKVSSTSISLNWTCMLPDMCQHLWARCRLEHHSSPPCVAEEVKVEEMLQGQEGTFTCSPLQPFTVYSVTISLPPSTILYTEHHTTKEMVPDKPEELCVNRSTGSVRWKALPSCKGKIIGYQLNITTMRAQDSSFLEFNQVLVNQSVSEYVPPHQTAGSKYRVTVQGLTAAGAGAASHLEFETYIWVSGEPLGPWPGSAVIVVVVVVLLVPLSVGILWFMLSRKKAALPSKAEEDHYTELQPYENVHEDKYCEIKTFLEKDAGKCHQAGEPFPKLVPVLESSGESKQ